MRSPVSSSSIACCHSSRCGSRIAPTIVGTPMRTSGNPNSACFARDDEVAPRHQREPVPEAVAVHRGDHRLEDLPAALERVDRRLLPERARELAGRPGAVAHVGARAERLARAGHDRDPRVFLVAEAGERGVEIVAHLTVDRVQRLGPVVRDRRDVSVELVPNGVTHAAIRNGSTGAAATPVF